MKKNQKLTKEQFNEIIQILFVSYPKYFKTLDNSCLTQLVHLYRDVFNKYSYEVAIRTTHRIVRKYNMIPSLKDIIDELDSIQNSSEFEILELMKDAGYFKYNNFQELPKEAQQNHYNKAQEWIASGMIPNWFLKEMQRYGYNGKATPMKHNVVEQNNNDDVSNRNSVIVTKPRTLEEPINNSETLASSNNTTIEDSKVSLESDILHLDDVITEKEKIQNEIIKDNNDSSDFDNKLADLLNLEEVDNEKLTNLDFENMFKE